VPQTGGMAAARVMIVEDNDVVRKFCASTLSRLEDVEVLT
jgi:hypothetical protein|tara:strand:- start:230 stop:349 length:120 start_codon:yes stop_codon:yes gene_type:complete